MKERDEQRRAEADELPADEEDLDVAGQRDEQHAGHEHRQQDEVAVVAGLPVQVSIRKRRHDAGDGRRERGEPQREPIDEEFDRDAAFVRGRPGAVRQKLRARSGRAVHHERHDKAAHAIVIERAGERGRSTAPAAAG